MIGENFDKVISIVIIVRNYVFIKKYYIIFKFFFYLICEFLIEVVIVVIYNIFWIWCYCFVCVNMNIVVVNVIKMFRFCIKMLKGSDVLCE